MPHGSGEELLARLRADPRWSGIPVALMSGDPGRLSFRAIGGLPVLAKPFTIDELNEVLARHCSGLADQDAVT